MNEIIRPGVGILFMKVGTHAQEDLAAIIARKSKEIEDAGFAMWGYGGNTCHPRTMVQPFAEAFCEQGKPIYLCMQEMASSHFAEPLRAGSYSVDGITWQRIPDSINVLGSRFALTIKNLRRQELILPLDRTRVAVGNNRGRIGSRYLQGHVDKACLEVIDTTERSNLAATREVKVNLMAELEPPYAVFLRDHT
ncbi:MAG: hypothetical protein WB611_32250 [Stellaceae bacterium]